MLSVTIIFTFFNNNNNNNNKSVTQISHLPAKQICYVAAIEAGY